MKTRNKVLLAVLASIVVSSLASCKSEPTVNSIKPVLECTTNQKFHSNNSINWTKYSDSSYVNKKIYAVDGTKLLYKFDSTYTVQGTKAISTYDYSTKDFVKETSIRTYNDKVQVKTLITLLGNSSTKYYAEIDTCKPL